MTCWSRAAAYSTRPQAARRARRRRLARGRIAAVDADIPEEAAFRTIQCAGALVLPGLVDLHTHVFHGFSFWGVDPDPIATRTGVTTWNDAGTPGAMTIEGFRRHIVDEADVRITTYLNIAYIGLVGENYETANLEYCDAAILRRAVDRHRDLVRGIKVRIGTPTVGDTGVESLRRAVQAGKECELPVMVHIAIGPPSIDEVLDLLRPGDICTHSFTGLSMKLVDDQGRAAQGGASRARSRRSARHRARDGLVRVRQRGGAARGRGAARHDLHGYAPAKRVRPDVRPANDDDEVPRARNVARRRCTGRDVRPAEILGLERRSRHAAPGRARRHRVVQAAGRASSRSTTSTATCALATCCCETR